MGEFIVWEIWRYEGGRCVDVGMIGEDFFFFDAMCGEERI